MTISHTAAIAWARLHMTFVLDDIAGQTRAAERVPHYERLMAQYPELAAACQEQIDQIMHPGLPARLPSYAQPARRAIPTLYTPMPADPEDDEEDMPF